MNIEDKSPSEKLAIMRTNLSKIIEKRGEAITKLERWRVHKADFEQLIMAWQEMGESAPADICEELVKINDDMQKLEKFIAAGDNAASLHENVIGQYEAQGL